MNDWLPKSILCLNSYTGRIPQGVDCAFAVTPVRECRHDVVDPAEKQTRSRSAAAGGREELGPSLPPSPRAPRSRQALSIRTLASL